MTRTWGFGAGTGVGVVLAIVAIVLSGAQPAGEVDASSPVRDWVVANLGHSVWPFAVVLTLYVFNLHRLKMLLDRGASAREVGEVDQLIDVWTHLFVGVGVIWTAVGMRSALVSALADPDAALVDTAGNVLARLVDGGILVALSTTIVGGIGGYLMRLVKTVLVGARLYAFYEAQDRRELRDMVASLSRIEARLEERARPNGAVGMPAERLA